MLTISSPLPRGVRRALQVIHANVGQRQNVSQLADVAGVSARTLQRQFMDFLGKSPHAVWQDVGLEQARHELLQGARGDRIADVALRCGFAHFGRFSREYRRRYGETPSCTLKRQETEAEDGAAAKAL